jgi:aspartyl-tRNA(Asn)/glutamyl-tRNA(Gln) amidotransferase subunit C
MTVTRAEVLKIAELAKLGFSESELDAFTAQFQHILDYIEKLKEVDVDGVEPTSRVSTTGAFAESRFREDEPRAPLPVEEALNNAPDSSHQYFRVPRIIQAADS